MVSDMMHIEFCGYEIKMCKKSMLDRDHGLVTTALEHDPGSFLDLRRGLGAHD